MKNYICILLIIFILNSCLPYNRITSPQVLDKEERNWTFGIVIDEPLTNRFLLTDESIIPVIGYRTGIASNHEIGITQYGLYSQVIDYKHQFYKKGDFIFSGDLALFNLDLKPYGIQYDLLFGSKWLYGTCGINYHEDTFWIFGIGSEFKNNKSFGFQLSVANGFPHYIDYNGITKKSVDRFISLGLKFDIKRIKKKYRNSSD